MRFILDEDVDEQCRSVLQGAGHEAWTVTDAGRSSASDQEQLIYAHDNDAVFVTGDRELTTSRRAMPIGRILRLRGQQWKGPELLGDALEHVVPILQHNPNIIVTGRGPPVVATSRSSWPADGATTEG